MIEMAPREPPTHASAPSTDFPVTERLLHMALGSVTARSFEDALQHILETAVDTVGADFGNVQILDPRGRHLEIAAEVGFDEDFLATFRTVTADDDTACGRALRTGKRIVISDVDTEVGYEPYREAAARAGYRAVQSTPLFGRSGEAVGVLSTHFADRREFGPDEEALLDRLAEEAALLIAHLRERARIEESERSASFLSRISEAMRALSDPSEVTAVIARLLGEHLGVERAFFAEADPGGEHVVIVDDYHDGVAAAAGRYRIDDFGLDVAASFRAGRTHVVDDIDRVDLSEEERARYEAIDVRAHLTVSLVRDGRLVTLLGVRSARPRTWTPAEVSLVEKVAERTWDAVERARVEAALRRRNDRFQALFDSIDDGFCVCEMIVDGDGRGIDYRFLEVNPVFEAMTGLHGAEGRTALELVPGLEARWVETYAKAALGRESLRFQDGSEAMGRWFDVYATPVGPAAERQFALVFRDITERRRREEERRRLLVEAESARTEAEEANRSKSVFLANMSHELRTPLNAIVGYSDLLLAGVPAPIASAALGHVDRIQASARHLIGLIEEILTFAKIEAGEERVELGPVGLCELIVETGRIVEALAAKKGLAFRWDVPDERVVARTDAARVRQILLNLVSNAVKFTDAGSVSLELETADDVARIVVRDTGVGVEPEELDVIFEPFRQAGARTDDARPSERPGGTGLGLSVSRSLAELLGGGLTAESEPGRGSTFTLTLPLAGAEVGSGEDGDESGGTGQSRDP